MASAAERKPDGPIYTTVAFKSADEESWKAFWAAIRKDYAFSEDVGDKTTQAFAVSMGDMFRHQDIIEAILESDLAPDEMAQAIGDTFSYADPEQALKDWGIAPDAQVSK